LTSTLIGAAGAVLAISPTVLLNGSVRMGFSDDYWMPVDAEAALIIEFSSGWAAATMASTFLILCERHHMRIPLRVVVLSLIAIIYSISSMLRYYNSTCASIVFGRLSKEEREDVCNEDLLR
jgi:hypothetical protein